MTAFTEAYVDLEELVKKNWIFSEEKIKGFMETNPVQRSLREQVEFLVDANHILQKRFDDLVADQEKNMDAAGGMAETHKHQANLEEQVVIL